MTNFLEKNKIQKAIIFHEGCLEFRKKEYKKIEAEVGPRLLKAKEIGADKEGHQHHALYLELKNKLVVVYKLIQDEEKRIEELNKQL